MPTLRQTLVQINAEAPKEQGTKIAHYEEKGPYSCGVCEYLRDKNLCNNKKVLSDSGLKTDKDSGLKIVNARTGCCSYVEVKKK